MPSRSVADVLYVQGFVAVYSSAEEYLPNTAIDKRRELFIYFEVYEYGS